jgi:hypothetical protein
MEGGSMARIAAAALLVAAGLGIGLWLGFNTESRAAVEENWQRAGDSIARIQVDLDFNPGSAGSAPAENDNTSEGTQTPQASPLAALSRVIQDFWEATQRLWSSLLARVELSG